MPSSQLWRNYYFLFSWGSIFARMKLKGIDGKASPGVELAA